MNLEQLHAAQEAYFAAHGTAPTVLKLSYPEWDELRSCVGVQPLLTYSDYLNSTMIGGLRIEHCVSGWSLG